MINKFPKTTSNNLIMDRITYLDIPHIVECANDKRGGIERPYKKEKYLQKFNPIQVD